MATSASRADTIINDRLKSEEELLDELELEEIPASIRESRMKQFKCMANDLSRLKETDHGKYTEMLEEKKFLDSTISEDRCVVHFFHPDFNRCSIMDRHLKVLAEKHFETRFLKINVNNAPFFVRKLKVLVLPTIIFFKKGVIMGRLIGFEELGNSDDFRTETLEDKLQKAGIIFGRENSFSRPPLPSKKKFSRDDDDEE